MLFPLPADVGARLLVRVLGGSGSGNFGHAGRPGEVGGSGPGGIGPRTGDLVDSRTSGRTTWYDLHGQPVTVYVNAGVSQEMQQWARDAIQMTPMQLLEAGSLDGEERPDVILRREITSKAGEGMFAAGRYSELDNTIELSQKSATKDDVRHVWAHELGHAMHANSAEIFGGEQAITKAYQKDAADIAANKPSAFRRLSYYRASDKEAFAESVATHLFPTLGRHSSLYSKSFTETMKVAETGIQKLLAMEPRVN